MSLQVSVFEEQLILECMKVGGRGNPEELLWSGTRASCHPALLHMSIF